MLSRRATRFWWFGGKDADTRKANIQQTVKKVKKCSHFLRIGGLAPLVPLSVSPFQKIIFYQKRNQKHALLITPFQLFS